MPEWIGWLSSGLLVATLGRQVFKQWQAGTSAGVSLWFYVGQITAQIGFILYSYSLGNMVFLVTNGVMLILSVLGLALLRAHRTRYAGNIPT